MHLLSSPQEQRGYSWEYLTGCYHLFILPQAIYQTLSKISRITFPQTRSFDVLRPNVFFREVSSYFPKTETVLFYSFCLSCLTVLTYFPYFFNWRFLFQNKQKVISLSTFFVDVNVWWRKWNLWCLSFVSLYFTRIWNESYCILILTDTFCL